MGRSGVGGRRHGRDVASLEQKKTGGRSAAAAGRDEWVAARVEYSRQSVSAVAGVLTDAAVVKDRQLEARDQAVRRPRLPN